VSGRRGRLRALANTVAVVGQITAAGVIGAVLAPRVAEAATSVPPAARAPLAAALTTASGSWAVVAMGQRGAPLNTFWQIFFRPSGAASWTLVTPTGVADNGGLTLTAAGDGSVTAGFEPSQLLHYSPLARSDDEGSSWSPALVPASLVAGPDAVAVAGRSGPALALTRHGSGQVLASSGSLLRWAPLSGSGSPTGAAASRCEVEGLDAVAFGPSATPMVGTGCRRPGQVGVFARDGGAWRLIGPTLAGALAASSTRVLRLNASGSTRTALVAAAAAGHSELLALWRAPAGAWLDSAPLSVGPAQRILATAVGLNGEQLVLLSKPGTNGELEVASGPGLGWTALASPPAGTATLALIGDGSVDAFSVNGSGLRIFTVAPRQSTWALTQSLNVPLAYGSS
jgi:hypothetical protein